MIVTTDVNPWGRPTSVTIEYGSTPALGSTSAAIPVKGYGSRPVVHSISGLTANTPYYYRATMASDIGTSVTKRGIYFNNPTSVGTVYHVKTSGAGGNDTNNGLTAGASKRTLAGALAVAVPGDRIYVHTGSYPGETLTSIQKTGLVRIMAAGDGAVNFQNILLNNSRWLSFENIGLDGHSLTDVDGTHLFEAFGASSGSKASDIYWVNGAINAAGKTSSCMCIRASDFATRIHFINTHTSEGGNGVKAFVTSGSPSTNWPDHWYFTNCEFGPSHTWDCVHLGGFQTWKFYDCSAHDVLSLSGFADTGEEHHDAMQLDYGDDLYVENYYVYDHTNTISTGPNNVVLSDDSGTGTTNCTFVNMVVESWPGAGVNLTKHTNFKFINCTIGNCPGPGDGVHQASVGSTADFIADNGGGTGSGFVARGNIVHEAFITAASPTITKNHFVEDRSASNNKGTGFTTGAVTYNSSSDLHLANGTQLAASGGALIADDSAVLTYGNDGRGKNPSNPGKGAYSVPTNLSPVGIQANAPSVIYASTTGSGSVTYEQAQYRTTPATFAQALTLHKAADRIELEPGSYTTLIGSSLLAGLGVTQKTTVAAVDQGASGKPLITKSDGSAVVFLPSHDYLCIENIELKHGDAATTITHGEAIVTTDSSVQARNIDLLGCKIGNTRFHCINSKYGPTPSDAAGHAGTPGLNDSGWRIFGTELYRANQHLIVAHGSGWELGAWHDPTGAVIQGHGHWWGDSTEAGQGNGMHGIYHHSRGMIVHDWLWHNEEASAIHASAISQRASGLEIYNNTFHDCVPFDTFWYDNQRSQTRFHDNRGWNLYNWGWFFAAQTDTAPAYTWAAGTTSVDDFIFVKNTLHFIDTSTNGSSNVFDLTDASAAYVGKIEIADNVIVGAYVDGWDLGTRGTAFLSNNSFTGTLHSHHNIWKLDTGSITFRHQNTSRNLVTVQGAGSLSGFAQETGSSEVTPNLGLQSGSGSSLISGTYGAPDYWPQLPAGPTVNTGAAPDDTGLVAASIPGQGKYAKASTAVDIGATEFTTTTMPTFVQGTTGVTTDLVSSSVTTGTLGATPTPNNLLVLAVFWQGSVNITNPSGWTLAHTVSDTSSFKTAFYYKTALTGEPTSVVVSFNNPTGCAVILEEWTGVDAVTPVETAADGTITTAGADATAIAITGAGNPGSVSDIAVTYVGWRQNPSLTLGTGTTGTTWTAQTAKFSTTGATGNNIITAESALSSSTLSTSSAASFAGTLASARRFGAAMLVFKAFVPTSPPANTSAPVVTPTTGIVVTTTLSATTGAWSNTPTSFTYQWRRNGSDISGATSANYAVQVADANASVLVVVTASNTAGSGTAVSNTVSVPGVPVNSVLPGISGATSQGSTLTATTGTWTNSPTSFAYQWRRDAGNISGATSSTYSIAGADLGHGLTCRITATNSFGSGTTADSNSLSIPSSAYGQGPAVVGLEIIEWPSTLMVAGTPTSAWSNFVPVLFPISPEGLPTFSAKQMRTATETSPPAGSQLSMAIYSYSYASAGTFSASLVGTTAANSATTANPKMVDIISGPLDIDFTQNRYFLGIMTNLGPKILHNTPGNSKFSVLQFSVARASLTDWPSTFSQANVVTYSSGWPYIALGTTTSTWFI